MQNSICTFDQFWEKLLAKCALYLKFNVKSCTSKNKCEIFHLVFNRIFHSAFRLEIREFLIFPLYFANKGCKISHFMKILDAKF